MKHLVISDYGSYLGYSDNLLIIRKGDAIISTQPLTRVKSISIIKPGISLSAALIANAAQRGIKIFFHNYTGQPVACLAGAHGNAVCAVRRRQFEFITTVGAFEVAKRIISGKIINQRAVLKYFQRYHGGNAANTDFDFERVVLTLGKSVKIIK